MGSFRRTMQKASRVPLVGSQFARFDAFLADLDEIVAGKGDGVVAVKRGRLKGVDDTIVLPFCHLTVTGDSDDQIVRRVHKHILARLER